MFGMHLSWLGIRLGTYEMVDVPRYTSGPIPHHATPLRPDTDKSPPNSSVWLADFSTGVRSCSASCTCPFWTSTNLILIQTLSIETIQSAAAREKSSENYQRNSNPRSRPQVRGIKAKSQGGGGGELRFFFVFWDPISDGN